MHRDLLTMCGNILKCVTHVQTEITESIPTFSEGRSGSSWQSLARKLLFSLQRVVFVVRNTLPPMFNFTHSSREEILSDTISSGGCSVPFVVALLEAGELFPVP